jgi:fructoselysine and glucoselysine-specific PTS system IIB component
MIQMIRVDYRLLHGQVAVSWTATLGADALLLVSDTLQSDPLRMETLQLAKPSGVKTVVKNTEQAIETIKSGKTDNYKVFVICETIQSADKIARAFNIKSINLGNISFGPDKEKLSKSIYVNSEEKKVIQNLIKDDYDLFIQMVPTENKIEASKVI